MRLFLTVVMAGGGRNRRGLCSHPLAAALRRRRFGRHGRGFGILGAAFSTTATMPVMGTALWRARSENDPDRHARAAGAGRRRFACRHHPSEASINLAREAQGLPQFIVPLCLTAIVQRFLLLAASGLSIT